MKESLKRVVFGASVFLIGAALGAGGMFGLMNRVLGRSAVQHAGAAASSRLGALAPLQAHDTARALERLETALNGDIVTLGALRHSLHGEQAVMVANVLVHIRDYRAQHPFTTGDAAQDAAVQEILNRADGK